MEPINQTADPVALAEHFKVQFARLKAEIRKVIVGQDEVVEQVLISMFCRSHSLLVGVPGLAKTLLIQTIASATDLSFNRIQFTPDLMPGDITGSETLDNERNFKFVRGPIFANIILADEINRTPPKTQSALLEAMQEHAVTVAGQRHVLPDPFFVLATQNPIEQEGTYPLPEAQLDRFMFNIKLGYPTLAEEMEIIKATTAALLPKAESVIGGKDLKAFQQLVRQVPVTDNVVEYAVKLVAGTRPGATAHKATTEYLEWGAGPRASQFLVLGAKCYALTQGKFSPDIDDVKAVALPILRHRVVRNFKAEAEGVDTDTLIAGML